MVKKTPPQRTLKGSQKQPETRSFHKQPRALFSPFSVTLYGFYLHSYLDLNCNICLCCENKFARYLFLCSFISSFYNSTVEFSNLIALEVLRNRRRCVTTYNTFPIHFSVCSY